MVGDPLDASKPESDDAARPPHRVPLPAFDNKLCMVDCGRALASLAWVWNKESGDSHFLFGTIDLVPDELPLLDCPPKLPCVNLGNRSSWRVYFADHAIPSSTAVAWYEGLTLRGEWGASWLDPQIKKPVPVDERVLEPRWPRTVVLGSTKAVPFASGRKEWTRAHHTLATTSKLNELIETSKERTALVEALKARRQVDLEDGPHLSQSAHLFAPLPVLRHYKMRLPSDERGDSAVLVDLIPRLGQRLDQLTIEVLEERPTGRRLLAVSRTVTPLVSITLAEDVEQVAIRVIHDELGLLIDDGPHYFLQAASINTQMITSYRRVDVPERGRRPAEVHKIPVAGMDQLMLMGSERGASATGLLQAAASKRPATGSGKQRWFRDEPATAQQHIREIVATATVRLIVIDPYFTEREVLPYLPWVTRTGVQVQVLTSTKGLRDTPHALALGADSIAKSAQRELFHLKDLQGRLEECVRERRINQTTVRVMTGDHPIHDRFLIVDEKVWVLGSSLNAFGGRGTMLIELENPQAVIPELLRYTEAASSKSLEERFAALLASQPPLAGSSP